MCMEQHILFRSIEMFIFHVAADKKYAISSLDSK